MLPPSPRKYKSLLYALSFTVKIKPPWLMGFCHPSIELTQSGTQRALQHLKFTWQKISNPRPPFRGTARCLSEYCRTCKIKNLYFQHLIKTAARTLHDGVIISTFFSFLSPDCCFYGNLNIFNFLFLLIVSGDCFICLQML
jgi:hypothetical protein